MEVSVSLLYWFVHEPPYQTVVVYCNPVFFAAILRACTTVPFLRYSGACSGSPQLLIVKYSNRTIILTGSLNFQFAKPLTQLLLLYCAMP